MWPPWSVVRKCPVGRRLHPGGQSYDDYRAFLPAVGFRELTRTRRGWTRL